MNDPLIMINPSSFPTQLATDAEKASKEFGLKVGQSIMWEWFAKTGNNCRYYSQWIDFHRIRLYARGEQSIAKYKEQFQVDGDMSHINLDWTPVPIIPKFVDIVVNGMNDRLFEVKAYSQDVMSAEKRSKFQEMVEADMAAKDYLLQVKANQKALLEELEESFLLLKPFRVNVKIPASQKHRFFLFFFYKNPILGISFQTAC